MTSPIDNPRTSAIIDKLCRFLVYIAVFSIPLLAWGRVYAKFDLPKAALFYAVTLLLLFLFMLKAALTGHIEIPRHKLLNFYWIFLLVMAVSTALSIHPWTSLIGVQLRYSNGLAGYLAIGIWLFVFSSFFSRTQYGRIWYILSASSALVAIYGILQAFGYEFLSFNDGYERITSTFGEPTLLSCFLVFMLPVALVQIFSRTELLARFAYWLLTILLLWSVLLTYSRAAWLACGLALLFVFGAMIYKKMIPWDIFNRIFLATFAVSLLAVVSFIYWDYDRDVERNINLQDRGTAVVARLDFWRPAPQLWLQHPILGSGPDTYGYVYSPYRSESLNNSRAWTGYLDRAHNEYIDRLVTTGSVGLGAYLLLMAYVMWRLFRTYVTNEKKFESLGVLAALLALSATIFFSFHSVITWFLFLLTFGAVITDTTEENKISKSIALTKVASLLLLALTTIAVIFAGYLLHNFVYAQTLAYRGHQLAKYEQQFASAEQYLVRSVELNPFEAENISTLSSVYFEHNFSQAVKSQQIDSSLLEQATYYGNKALQANPYLPKYPSDFGRGYYWLATFDNSLNNHAIEQFNKAIELKPTDPALHALKGICLGQLGDYEQAEASLLESLRLKSDLGETNMHLGELYSKMQRLDAAQTQFENALENGLYTQRLLTDIQALEAQKELP